MNSLQLISSKKEFFLLSFLTGFIFLFNFVYEYMKYKDFIKEEVYYSTFKILNIYDKKDFYVLKLQEDNMVFFTSIEKVDSIEKLQNISLAVISTKISFFDFLKGFYAKSLYHDELDSKKSFKTKLFSYIENQHEDIKLEELFNALFLAVPISKENRQIYTNFGISHLIAISGFHLAILSFIIYWIVYFPYKFIHKKYFIYRNKRADVIIITIVFLFFYLLLSNIVPSLLRSFVMFVLAFLFLRSNIKIVSFQTLGITLFIIISLFPQFLFSISFWFSIIGVFYIFLYIQYFKNLPKLFSFIFFNIWIFLVFNPVVHFFFYNTSYEQLLSPFITLVFTLFYPIQLVLHIFDFGGLLDFILIDFVNYEMDVFEIASPLWFFVVYIFVSIGSIFYNRAFILLNLLLVIFNIYLYLW